VRLLSAAFLLLIAGCDDQQQASSEPAAQQAAPTVIAARAARQPVTQSAEFVGRVEALEKVEIRERVTGILRDQYFREGQAVNEDVPLFTIEREPFEADVAVKQAKVESARPELANATLQLVRARELIRRSTIPGATLDQRGAEQGVAAASLSGARADIGLARIDLGYTEIRSPIAGRVSRAAITPGNVVGPEAGVRTVVVRQDPIRAIFPASQRQPLELRRQYRGQGMDAVRVRVRLPDGSFYQELGRVNFIDVQTDRATDTALVRAEIANRGKQNGRRARQT
jgi:membrane fusion protein (multidrug efflux system)